MLKLGANLSALRVQRQLGRTTSELSSTFERLSSGLRINRASDDAAGLAVASALNTDQRVYSQGVRNLNDGLSVLSVVSESITSLSNIVIRQRELAEQAANGIYDSSQRLSINSEAQALFEEYSRILQSTEFNGQSLLTGELNSIILQNGYGKSGELQADIRSNGTIETNTLVAAPGQTDTVYEMTGNGTSTIEPQFVARDVNGDGNDDLIAYGIYVDGGGNSLGQVTVFIGDSAGKLSKKSERTIKIGTNFGETQGGSISTQTNDSLLSGRFIDGVGNRLDFALTIDSNGNLGPILPSPYSGGNDSSTAVIGDFNNDGFDDGARASGVGQFVVGIQNTEVQTSYSEGWESIEQSAFSLATQGDARNALILLEAQARKLNRAKAVIGASQSRINVAATVSQIAAENFAAAESRIVDADIAFESSQLVRQNLLQQAGAAILAQANLQPQLALQLLQ